MKGNLAELNGVSGGSSMVVVGGISAILVGTVFFVTACLYLWDRVRCSGAFRTNRTAFLTVSPFDGENSVRLPINE
jgi:hypothetical protein